METGCIKFNSEQSRALSKSCAEAGSHRILSRAEKADNGRDLGIYWGPEYMQKGVDELAGLWE